MEIIQRNIEELRPHPKNPRSHPKEEIERIEKSIQAYGFTNPVLISTDNYIIAGHARVKAAKNIGLAEVPTVTLPLEGISAEAYMIADNKLADMAEWNIPTLKELLIELDTGVFDIELTGFTADEMEKMIVDWEADRDLDQEEKLVECPNCGNQFKP